ncbi:MAG: hypothetical protein HYU28_08730 [Actinobacteria bacterium]|nr:hypothetical protein [Actinomycetota bacterium]
MAEDDPLAWIPDTGARLTRAEVVEIMRTLRALVAGTAPDEPNRVHVISVAHIVTTAIDRERGTP